MFFLLLLLSTFSFATDSNEEIVENLKKFIKKNKSENFLQASQKYHQGLQYSLDKKKYLHPLPVMNEWGGLNHPPLTEVSVDDLEWIGASKVNSEGKNNLRRDVKFHQMIDQMSGSELTTGNIFSPFEDGRVLPVLVDLINKTQHTLWGSALLYACDEDTRPITDALIKKAKAGVDVRIMVDWGLQKLQFGKCLKELKASGVKIHRVRGIALHNSGFHVKLWMSDFTEGIFLGANLINVQTRSTGFNHLYHDSGTHAKGPVVTDMADRFLEMWRIYYKKTSDQDVELVEKIEQLKTQERLKKIRGQEFYQTWFTRDKSVCRVVTQERHLGKDRVSKVLHEYLKTAHSRIWAASVRRDFSNIENLKKGKNQILMEIFHKALKENVNVELLLNTSATPFSPSNVSDSRTDPVGKPSVITKALAFADQASAHKSVIDGARYYQLSQEKTKNLRAWSYFTFNHNKNVIIDDDFVLTGSYNPFAERSTIDAEISLFCQDQELNSIYTLNMARDLVNSIAYPLHSQLLK